MRLKEYLDINDIKYTTFARLLGVSYGTLFNIFWYGTHRLEIAVKIEELTMGVVTCKELVDPEIQNSGKKGRKPLKVPEKIKSAAKKSKKPKAPK